jgi:integrase
LKEAIRETMNFQRQIKENSAIDDRVISSNRTRDKRIPVLLIHAISRYLAWLNGEGVVEHLKDTKSTEHIKDIERILSVFMESLHLNNINIQSVLMNDLDDQLVGIFHGYLLNNKKFKNRTFNKYIGTLRTFVNWYSKEFKVSISDSFNKVKLRLVISNPQAISKEAFSNLLNQIKPENGFKYYANSKKNKRNYYTEYLKSAFIWALNTGLRREELCNLKHSDVVEKNNIKSLKVENYKVNRIMKKTNNEEKEFIFIPITDTLERLLSDAGHEQWVESDLFIIAPEVKKNRNKVIGDALSRGFTHFYYQIDLDNPLTFRCLRKTYITALSMYIGNRTNIVTNHSGNDVLDKYYIDKQVRLKVAKGFSIFPDEDNSNEQALELARKNQSEMEVEK